MYRRRRKDIGRPDCACIAGLHADSLRADAGENTGLHWRNTALKALLILILLAFGLNAAKATEVGGYNALLEKIEIGQLESFSYENGGFDIRHMVNRLLSGDLFDENEILRIIEEAAEGIVGSIGTEMVKLAIPVLLSAVMKILLGRKSVCYPGVRLFCGISAAIIMADMFDASRRETAELIEKTLSFAEAASPVIISALNLTGATTTASLLSPMSSLCAIGITWVLENICLKLAAAGALIASVGNLSESFSLKRLFKLTRDTVIWSGGIMMAAFTAMLSVQGLMGNSVDTMAMRGMQYTAETLIPVIGGNVSDSMDSLVASAHAIKNAVGITGILLLVSLCAKPLIKITVFMLSMKIASAVMEPLSEKGIVETTSQFGDVGKMLLVISVSGVLMVTLMIGAALVSAGNLLA